MPDRRPIIFRCEDELRHALERECEETSTNKTVLLNTILAERYGLPYEPSEQSARRTTPFGGGPRSDASA